MHSKALTQEYIKSILNYNRLTGVFTRSAKTSNSVNIGDIAGCVNRNGYVVIRVLNKLMYAHRLAWLYEYGHLPEFEIDHINGDRSDNRIANLRDVTRTENSKNLSMRSDNNSGVVGVCWSSLHNKWSAEIADNGKKVFLGLFVDINDAIKARSIAESKYNYHSNHGRSHIISKM